MVPEAAGVAVALVDLLGVAAFPVVCLVFAAGVAPGSAVFAASPWLCSGVARPVPCPAPLSPCFPSFS
ncbi:hypothetical protein, partial [Streptomyces venezuelae]